MAEALQARGYQVHRQVGMAGFFIDLAVADPEQPGRYLLGIECDGAAYHERALGARSRPAAPGGAGETTAGSSTASGAPTGFSRPSEQLERVIERDRGSEG